jgi:GNAT superfamily N-acetyltransferase
VNVRRIEPRDLGSLLELYHQLNPADILPDEDAVRTVWPQLLTDPRVLVFVGEVDGTVATTCTLVVVPNLTRGGRPYGLIENVVTASDHRQRGFGSSIMGHALEHAWQLHCYKVMLLTGSARDDTLRFYEKVGFQRGLKTGLVAYAPPVA